MTQKRAGVPSERLRCTVRSGDSTALVAIQDTSQHWPSWRETRVELNELPLRAENWNG